MRVVGANDPHMQLARKVDVAGKAAAAGKERRVLQPFRYANLDEKPAFARKVTTTEFLAKVVFDGLAAEIAAGALGPGGGRVARMRITLHESHTARAWYEGAV